MWHKCILLFALALLGWLIGEAFPRRQVPVWESRHPGANGSEFLGFTDEGKTLLVLLSDMNAVRLIGLDSETGAVRFEKLNYSLPGITDMCGPTRTQKHLCRWTYLPKENNELGDVLIIETQSGKEVLRIRNQHKRLATTALAGSTVLAFTEPPQKDRPTKYKLWNLETMQIKEGELTFPPDEELYALSPDGQLALFGRNQLTTELVIVDIASNKVIHEKRSSRTFSFSEDSQYFFEFEDKFMSEDHLNTVVHRWKREEASFSEAGKSFIPIDSQNAVSSVKVSHNTVISLRYHRTYPGLEFAEKFLSYPHLDIKLYDLNSSKRTGNFSVRVHQLNRVEPVLLPDSNHVVLIEGDGTVSCWNYIQAKSRIHAVIGLLIGSGLGFLILFWQRKGNHLAGNFQSLPANF